MSNKDNKKLCYIEGGGFESIKHGDERNAVIAHIKMPEGFKLSARPLIMLEIEEWDSINKPTCPNCAQFLDECLCIDEQEAKSFDLAAKAVAGIEDSLEQEAKPEHKPCPNCGGSNIESDTFDEGFFIECVTCDFRTGDYPSEVSAWACWDKEWK